MPGANALAYLVAVSLTEKFLKNELVETMFVSEQLKEYNINW